MTPTIAAAAETTVRFLNPAPVGLAVARLDTHRAWVSASTMLVSSLTHRTVGDAEIPAASVRAVWAEVV
jgi:hypothetical protein